LLISEYVDLVRDLIRIARYNGGKDKVIDNLLNQRTKYHGLSLRPRLNKDIVEGRFDIDEIVRIERRNDEHTISDKTFDFFRDITPTSFAYSQEAKRDKTCRVISKTHFQKNMKTLWPASNRS
jgi:hypothetical protein